MEYVKNAIIPRESTDAVAVFFKQHHEGIMYLSAAMIAIAGNAIAVEYVSRARRRCVDEDLNPERQKVELLKAVYISTFIIAMTLLSAPMAPYLLYLGIKSLPTTAPLLGCHLVLRWYAFGPLASPPEAMAGSKEPLSGPEEPLLGP